MLTLNGNYYTLPDAVDYARDHGLQINAHGIRCDLYSDALPHIKTGGSRLIHEPDLVRYVERKIAGEFRNSKASNAVLRPLTIEQISETLVDQCDLVPVPRCYGGWDTYTFPDRPSVTVYFSKTGIQASGLHKKVAILRFCRTDSDAQVIDWVGRVRANS